jgi:DNA-binding transcriptional LysR family regulator
MIDELRLMAIFAKTVELKSFRKAALQLKLSPSVVSHHITELERRLGVTLLYRSTRSLALTHEGQQLFQAAQAMISAAQEGLNTIAIQSKTPSGSLNLSLPAILTRSFLISDIAAFSEKYPKIKLNINLSDNEKDLIQDSIDLAVRIGELEDSPMKARHLFQIERKVVVSSKLYRNLSPIKKPEDLCNQKWIAFRHLPNFRSLTHRDGQKFRLEFKPSLLVDSVDGACELAKAGAGFTTPPSFLVEQDIRLGNFIEVLPDWRLQPLDAFLLWHPNTPKAGLPILFKNFLLAHKKLRESNIFD